MVYWWCIKKFQFLKQPISSITAEHAHIIEGRVVSDSLRLLYHRLNATDSFSSTRLTPVAPLAPWHPRSLQVFCISSAVKPGENSARIQCQSCLESYCFVQYVWLVLRVTTRTVLWDDCPVHWKFLWRTQNSCIASLQKPPSGTFIFKSLI